MHTEENKPKKKNPECINLHFLSFLRVENKNIQPQILLPIFQQIKWSAMENENIHLSKT